MRGWIDDRSYLVIASFSAAKILQRISTQVHRQLLYEQNKNLKREGTKFHQGLKTTTVRRILLWFPIFQELNLPERDKVTVAYGQ
jgi:hypothetical protein